MNVSIGTIFSIMQRRSDTPPSDAPLSECLQPGTRQVAAGYVVYSSSTVMAYTTGHGVHMFTLDPSFGAYVLTRASIQMPPESKMYSVNEAYRGTFPAGYQRYLAWAKSKDAGNYSLRYIGSLVASPRCLLL